MHDWLAWLSAIDGYLLDWEKISAVWHKKGAKDEIDEIGEGDGKKRQWGNCCVRLPAVMKCRLRY